MLPTPDTSHVPFTHVYEPAEDSYLLLDTLSSPTETSFLRSRFSARCPLVLEVGSGSGVVISFIHAHAQTLFGTRDVLAAAVDTNRFACAATTQTVQVAQRDHLNTHGLWLGAVTGDLTTPWRRGTVDVLAFNPPYVPTEEVPIAAGDCGNLAETPPPHSARKSGLSYDQESYLLSLSYAGGLHGMEVTNRLIEALPDMLSDDGCAYILLCAQNRPEEVKARIRGLPCGRVRSGSWVVDTVGVSGAKAGWEKLCIIRAWREWDDPAAGVESKHDDALYMAQRTEPAIFIERPRYLLVQGRNQLTIRWLHGW